MAEDTVFVTAVYSPQTADDLSIFFQSSLRLVIFTDIQNILNNVNNVNSKDKLVIHLPKTELLSFTQKTPVLPSQRNAEKDTLEFLQLSNAKPEFLKRASEQISAECYVWIDASIIRLTKHPKRFMTRLGNAYKAIEVVPGKVIAPGCIRRSDVKLSAMFDRPLWRFCGPLLIIPKQCIIPFFQKTSDELQKCWLKDSITWESNIWAAVEEKSPELFHWYLADHNDSILEFPYPRAATRVILLTMIKNESRIIKRMIESAKGIADAVCVCDTGSTDNTVEVLREYFKDFQIPTRVAEGPEHSWKNFGHNRTQSFREAVKYCASLGWDPETTYAVVLDADMQLRPQPGFEKSELKAIGYKIIQKSGSLEYYNTRFLKIAHPWTCAGVTHEYWDGGNTDTFGMDKIYIADIGDGGCKSDKFERDVRLLEEGLRESPNNPRYLFYLAQSYKDSKQIDKSIEFYKKRIDAGGWVEEVWYSMYMIMKLYAEKNMPADMEYWGLKAYEYRKERSENLLFMTRYFRDKRQYWKAWHYCTLGVVIKKPDDLLFIESDVYERGFDYERSIIHDYIFPEKKHQSLEYALTFYNKWRDQSMYSNFQWFVQKVPSIVQRLEFQEIGDYVATSTSILPLRGVGYRLNVRYVNYRIQPNGSYLMSENGILSGENPVRTKNYTSLMDARFGMISPLQEMTVASEVRNVSRIKGLEDVRIFYDAGGALKCLGTTMEYSYDGKIRQVLADYNHTAGLIENLSDLKAPIDTDCEKNWIPYKGNRYIYGWCPFRIGQPDASGKLVLDVHQETPAFLSNMRGSTCLFKDGDYFYGLTHCVMYQQPRKYYHMVVKIDARTDLLEAYTEPFFFCSNAIEYSLGLVKKGDVFVAIVSQNDRNPVLVHFKDADVRWRSVVA
jgi:glycosyltransferase involved in cell wall biosynthesis